MGNSFADGKLAGKIETTENILGQYMNTTDFKLTNLGKRIRKVEGHLGLPSPLEESTSGDVMKMPPKTPEKGGNTEFRQCIICCLEPVEIVLVPCGHHDCCEDCAEKVNICPVCRQPINMRQKVYCS